ncbi:MAG: polysaccharide deacetylase family protein [Myxococcales bacterium]|nr:polysaccharide deacetylase family protein [Myxococcales bacterium]
MLLGCHPSAPPSAAAVPDGDTTSPGAGATTIAEDSPPAAAERRVHLTFDDAPVMSEPGDGLPGPERVMAINEAIVGTLRERDVPASVFFNCSRLQPHERSVELWAAAGLTVGNHTDTHAKLSKVPLDEWMDDVIRCDQVLRERLPRPPHWFRYPYLDQGDRVELRDEAARRLAELGYANAHVTVATTEWLLAYVYREASRRGDEALRDEVVAAYRQHMVEAVEQGWALAEHEVGHGTAQVALLHVNELAADHLGEVIDDLRARGWTLVGLEEALDDPVFDRPDHYVGRGGLSWLARIHDESEPRPSYWFGEEEARLMQRYGELWRPPAGE